jgi:nucleotide-binding universal stress UspA family protein
MGQKARADLAAAAASLSHPAPQAAVEVITSSHPAVEIVQRVLREDVDLVVKSVEQPGARGFKALDMQLLRQCPCALWLSRPIARRGPEIRVAVAIDPDDVDAANRDLQQRLLRAGQALASDCDGLLRVVSCWDFPLENFMREHPLTRISPQEVDALVHETRREHRARLDALLAGLPGARLEAAHLRGTPDAAVPAYVEQHGVDILVMGTVARTGIPGWVIGNTAENLVGDLACSLLALKPSGFVSAIKAY